MMGVIIVMLLAALIDFSWFAVGLSALLTWLVNVPGPRRDRLKGIATFMIGGAALL